MRNSLTFSLLKNFALFILLFVVFSCKKDDAIKIIKVTKLPQNYSFSTGYCEIRTLGIHIPDTSIYSSPTFTSLSPSVMLNMPEPGDQGSQGSCTAWACGYAAGSYTKRLSQGHPLSYSENISPAFTYNQIAKGICGCTSIPDHLYLLKTQRASDLATMPYNQNDCSIQPETSQQSNPGNYQIKGWKKLDVTQIEMVKHAISDSFPVIFAINVDEGFSKLDTPYIFKEPSGNPLGGHAMVVTGYDDSKNAFRIINSWSTLWADKGFAWIEYSYFVNNTLGPGYIILKD